MPSVFDVAAYILQRQGSMTTMKLQKLVYYSQAWSLVWDEAPLFEEKIEAWASGPVVRALYEAHKGSFLLATQDLRVGDPAGLTDCQRETVDAVLEAYGNKPAQWLSDLTHMEEPWNMARRGVSPGENSENEITHAMMCEYYSSLPPECALT